MAQSFHHLLSISLLLLLSSSVWSQTVSVGDFDWLSITPSNSLLWTPCYGPTLQCARLAVPIDYSSPEGEQAAIAIIKLPSQLSANDTNYHGPLFTNPGGPGGSGIGFVLQDGPLLAASYPNFDLISFDPRGVGVSTPAVTFLKTPAERAIFDLSIQNTDVNETTPSLSISHLRAQAQALGNLAKARDNGIFAHVTTDNVARDMLRMVDALNQTKLQYYGFSYGTVLGATFATLFPDKVGRMVLDGVVNTTAWFENDWARQIIDADKAVQFFIDSCHDAGAQACPFFAPTTIEMANKLEQITSSARQEPYNYIIGNSTFGVADYALVRALILLAIRNPYPGFITVAAILAEVGNTPVGGTIIVPATNITLSPNTWQCPAGGGNTTDNSFESQMAVICGDVGPRNDTAGDLIRYFEENVHLSSFLNEFMIPRTVCSGWKISHQHFSGPIGANVSFPILFVGNTVDPVTPHAAAVESSKAFPGSAVLTQDSAGHTSLSSPSACTVGHISQYLVNGTLPAAGTICPVDRGPFASTTNNTSTGSAPSFVGKKAFSFVRKDGHPLLSSSSD